MPAKRNIPFFNYRAVFAEDPEGFTEVFRKTMAAGQIILQAPVEEFEKTLQYYLGCKYAIGLANCTNAMTLGLCALDLKPGDEVIICSHTFLATAQAIFWTGAVPIPVEMQADGMIDPNAAEAAITRRTRVILATDLNGRTCDMERLEIIAQRHGIVLATDSAQALGSSFDGRRSGTFGVFGAFSFYPSKLLGGFGDGGALTTNDNTLAERVRRMRNHGANAKKEIEPDYPHWGTNCRIDTLHAAILNYKFSNFPMTLARRRQIARTYHAALSDIDDLRLPPGPDGNDAHFDVYQNYELETGRRETLRQYLTKNGVGTIIQWDGEPVHRMHGLGFNQCLPRTEAFFERCFLLPMNQYMSDEDVFHVCTTVRSFYGLNVWYEMSPVCREDTPKPIMQSGQ